MSSHYTYAESNYSPVYIYSLEGDRRRDSIIVRPIAPDWEREEIPLSNEEVYNSPESLTALEYVNKIQKYYTSEHTKDWPELERANKFLQENPEMPVAKAVAKALQDGKNPLDALKKEAKKKLEKLNSILS